METSEPIRLVVLTSSLPFYNAEVLAQILINTQSIEEYRIEIWINKKDSNFVDKLKVLNNQLSQSGLFYVASKLKYFMFFRLNSIRGKSDFKLLSQLRNTTRLQFIEFDDLNRLISKSDRDILFSLYYDSIIPRAVLNRFDRRINLHPSLLPSYKGVSPVFWVLAKGEKFSGFTFHELTPKVDSGKILFQEKVFIEKNDTFHTLYLKISERAGRIFSQFLDRGEFPAFFLENLHESRYSIPNSKAFVEFRRASRKLI